MLFVYRCAVSPAELTTLALTPQLLQTDDTKTVHATYMHFAVVDLVSAVEGNVDEADVTSDENNKTTKHQNNLKTTDTNEKHATNHTLHNNGEC